MHKIDKALLQRAERAEAKVEELRTELQLVRMERDTARDERDNERRVAEVRLERIEELRCQLADHDSEASSACQEWDIKCQDLQKQLEAVKALVPPAVILEGAAVGTRTTAPSVSRELKRLAARIREWRGGQGEGEGDGN